MVTIPSGGTPLNVPQLLDVPFKPFYSPADMLNLGIKGGQFGHDNLPVLYSLNPSLVKSFKSTNKWAQTTFDTAKNYFHVANAQSDRTLGVGQIYKTLHPLGWFEWYCRFYYGEKSRADIMRITQWIMGINVAWFYIKQDPTKLTDLTWQPMRRQDMLEWGVDPTLDPESYGCGEGF